MDEDSKNYLSRIWAPWNSSELTEVQWLWPVETSGDAAYANLRHKKSAQPGVETWMDKQQQNKDCDRLWANGTNSFL